MAELILGKDVVAFFRRYKDRTFTRASLNFFTLTFRALGRNHIASTPAAGLRDALF